MRRSRVQVRPNFTARSSTAAKVTETTAQKPSVKDSSPSTDSAKTESIKKDESSKEAVSDVTSNPVLEESKNTVDQPSSKALTTAGGRRSRIKPQVKVMAKPRGAARNAEQVKDTATPPVIESQVTTSQENSTPDQASEEVSQSLFKPEDESSSKEKFTENAAESANSLQGNQQQSPADQQSKEATGTPGSAAPAALRRSRFSKPKPNIIESGRKRARLSSLSGASDTDEEAHQSLKKGPPPVQRIAALASPPLPGTPERATTPRDSSEAEGLVASTAMEVDHEVSVSHSSVTQTTVKREGSARERALARKKVSVKQEKREVKRTAPLSEPVDKVKMKISDLIYYNPTANRMKSTIDEEERKKKNKETTDGASVVGSPRRSSVVDPTDRHSILSGNMDNRSVPRSRTSSIAADPDSPDEREEEPLLVPQIKVGPDGQIILNEESLVVKNPSLEDTLEEEGNVIEEFGNAPYRPSQYYGKSCKTKSWSWRETKKFYLALSVIGSDFSMMSSLFPGRDRVDLKKKFKKEEKQNRWLVDKALKDTKTYDLTIFDTLSSSDDEETKKIKQKQEKERKRNEAREQKRLEREKVLLQKRMEREQVKLTKKKLRKKKLKSQYYDASSSDNSDDEGTKMPVPLEVTPVSGVIPSASKSPAKPEVVFNCDLCGKVLKSKTALRAHLYRHTKNLNVETKGLMAKEKKKSRPSAVVLPEPAPPIATTSTPAIAASTSGGQQQQQLVFVTSTTPADKDGTPGKSVVHMYMVSPPPAIPPGIVTPTGQPILCPPTVHMATASETMREDISSSRMVPSSAGSFVSPPGSRNIPVSNNGEMVLTLGEKNNGSGANFNEEIRSEHLVSLASGNMQSCSGETVYILTTQDKAAVSDNKGDATDSPTVLLTNEGNNADGSVWTINKQTAGAPNSDVLFVDLSGAEQNNTNRLFTEVSHGNTSNNGDNRNVQSAPYAESQRESVDVTGSHMVLVQGVRQKRTGEGGSSETPAERSSTTYGGVDQYEMSGLNVNSESSNVGEMDRQSEDVRDVVHGTNHAMTASPRGALSTMSSIWGSTATDDNDDTTTVLLPQGLNQLQDSAKSEEVQTIRIKIFNSPAIESDSCKQESGESQTECNEGGEIRLFLG